MKFLDIEHNEVTTLPKYTWVEVATTSGLAIIVGSGAVVVSDMAITQFNSDTSTTIVKSKVYDLQKPKVAQVSNVKIHKDHTLAFSYKKGHDELKTWRGLPYSQKLEKKLLHLANDCAGVVKEYVEKAYNTESGTFPSNAQCQFHLLKNNNLLASNDDVTKWNKNPNTIPQGTVVYFDHGVGTKVHHVGIRDTTRSDYIYQAKQSGTDIGNFRLKGYLGKNKRRIVGAWRPDKRPLTNDMLYTDKGVKIATLLNSVDKPTFKKLIARNTIGIKLANGVTI